MKVWIGCDHAGYALKKTLIAHLVSLGLDTEDVGCDGQKTDYPLIAKIVGEKTVQTPGSFGILVCGTGIGMSIAANKMKGVRAAVCAETYAAKFTRRHNDANVLCLGARVTGEGLAVEIADTFLQTPFEGGRHAQRVAMIGELEEKFGNGEGD